MNYRRTLQRVFDTLRSISKAELISLSFFVIVLMSPLTAWAQSLTELDLFSGLAANSPLPAMEAIRETPDLIFGLFIGIMMTASVYLFFIWVVIHDRGQVFLILLLACMGVYMACSNDSMMQLVGMNNHNMLNLLQSYSMILAFFFSLFFTYHFLEIETNAPFMRWPIILSAVALFILIVGVALGIRSALIALPIAGVATTCVVLLSGLAALRSGASGGLSHITAFFAFLVGILSAPLYDLGAIAYPDLAKNVNYIGFSIAAIMFSIVIAVQFATRQEEKERALEVSNERFSLAARGSNEGLFDWTFKTGSLYVSDQLRHIIGVSRDTTPQNVRGWLRLVVPEDRRTIVKAVHKLRDAPSSSTISFEFRILKNNKERLWIHTKMVAIKQHKLPIIDRLVGSIGDVTQRKRSEAELKASEIRFRSITEAHPVPVLIARLSDFQILYASPGSEILIGLPAGVLISQKLDRFVARALERHEIVEAISQGLNIDMKEVTIARGDGENLPAALSARRISYRGEDAMVIGLYDLTERKKAEIQIAQQQEALQQSEKMAALGGLLAGVAHELNNPLSVVMGQTTLLMEGPEETKTKTRAEKIFKAADRCSRIVKSFLALARRKPPEHRSISLNGIIHNSLELLSYQFRNENVELALDLAPTLPPVIGDMDQMTQVFTNLALNAAQAMHEWTGPHKLTIHSCVRPDGMIRIAFIDTGPGVPLDLRKRIFEPFFTTKGPNGGTGVGLALCVNIIASHGGTLTYEDTQGGGATFVMTLPAATSAHESAPEEISSSETISEKLRILLVDDEVELAQTLADLLEPEGHDIDLAANGAIALEKLQKKTFDAIISDLRMPVLDGPGLYAKLAETMPQYTSKIIYVTGDTLSPHVHTFLNETPVPVIEKPYRHTDVQKALLKLLKTNESQSNIASDSALPSPAASS